MSRAETLSSPETRLAALDLEISQLRKQMEPFVADCQRMSKSPIYQFTDNISQRLGTGEIEPPYIGSSDFSFEAREICDTKPANVEVQTGLLGMKRQVIEGGALPIYDYTGVDVKKNPDQIKEDHKRLITAGMSKDDAKFMAAQQSELVQIGTQIVDQKGRVTREWRRAVHDTMEEMRTFTYNEKTGVVIEIKYTFNPHKNRVITTVTIRDPKNNTERYTIYGADGIRKEEGYVKKEKKDTWSFKMHCNETGRVNGLETIEIEKLDGTGRRFAHSPAPDKGGTSIYSKTTSGTFTMEYDQNRGMVTEY